MNPHQLRFKRRTPQLYQYRETPRRTAQKLVLMTLHLMNLLLATLLLMTLFPVTLLLPLMRLLLRILLLPRRLTVILNI